MRRRAQKIHDFMKKTSLIFAVVILLMVVGYFFVQFSIGKVERSERSSIPPATYRTWQSDIEFTYRSGSDGYVVEEITPPENADGLIRTIVLTQTEDKQNEKNIPVGGERPPTISIHIFNNSEHQTPEVWAHSHLAYSNIHLKTHGVLETVVGGANAIRYMADGLYASENVVVTRGENAYIVTGMFLYEDSAIRRDFASLLKSIIFKSASADFTESGVTRVNNPGQS